jgi:integrase
LPRITKVSWGFVMAEKAAVSKKVLTTRSLEALKPAPKGSRDMHWDVLVPSFAIRVTDTGAATPVVKRRIGKTGNPVCRVVGDPWTVPLPRKSHVPFNLEVLRKNARKVISEMRAGGDPTEKKLAEAQEVKRRADSVFGLVAEKYIGEHVSKLKRPTEIAAAIRRAWEPVWDKQIADVTDEDVSAIVKAIAKDRPYAAYHAFAYGSGLFSWAIAARTYRLKTSPFSSLSIKGLIGGRDPRQRVLSDNELKVIWQATSKEAGLGYPLAPFVRMLILTGQRLREVAEATWSEFDLDGRVWTIPAERMKGDSAHEVPLSEDVVRLLEELPRGQGPFVFSTTDGARPISGFSKAKARIDRALVDVAPWRFHDLRRSVRTGLGGLSVQTKVAELVIAHAQPGLHKVYDLHKYRDEKRRALDLWARRVDAIVSGETGSKVIDLAKARG